MTKNLKIKQTKVQPQPIILKLQMERWQTTWSLITQIMHVILLIGVDIDKIDCMQLKSIIKKKKLFFLKKSLESYISP